MEPTKAGEYPGVEYVWFGEDIQVHVCAEAIGVGDSVVFVCGLVLCLSRTGLQTRRRRAVLLLHWKSSVPESTEDLSVGTPLSLELRDRSCPRKVVILEAFADQDDCLRGKRRPGNSKGY
jgi:hypothetical protein